MYDEIIAKYANVYNVPEPWIRAFIQTESSFNPTAYRAEPQINDASYGLMQLLYSTARGLGYTGTPEGLYDPETNIALGTKLMYQLRAKYGDDIQAVYSAYNSGSGTAYLSNSSVAQHVANMLKNFEAVIAANPVVASTGSFAIVLVAILIWYWTKRKK
jgi:soluble lytic murein transglycosylase-like protein